MYKAVLKCAQKIQIAILDVPKININITIKLLQVKINKMYGFLSM
jgi:hypothetical protein